MADNIDFALNDHFYDFVDDWNYKFYFLVGGYGSSKSYHVAVKLIKKLLEEKRKALVVREVFDTIRDSCYDLLQEVAEAMGVDGYLTFTSSPMQVKFSNGSRIIFKGMDKPAKLKSLNGVSIVWIEECSEVKYAGFKEILGRLRHPTLSNHIILSTNPVSKGNWCYKYFFQDKKKKVFVLDDEKLYKERTVVVGNTYYHHSTVDDNFFVPKEYVEQLDDLQTHEKLIAAYEKNHPDELESDIGQKIVERITGISKQRKMFEQKVKNINDIRVRTLLTQSLERTTIKRAKGRKSKYSASEKTVYLAKNAKVDTLAHELFHEIDDAYGLIENGLLSKSVISDYNKLQNLAKGYGKSIEEMLYSRYPKAFRKDTEKLALKEEYRGISDILNGMSSGEINLGYWHDKEYWKKTGRVEAESFAQFGRALYGGNPEVLDMFKSLFPNSYDEVSGRIERLIK